MHIFPAIDLRGGKVVRLEQGRAEAQTVYGDDPVAVAESFYAASHFVGWEDVVIGDPLCCPFAKSK